MRDLEDHRHCKVCGKPTAPGNDTCSNACAAVREERQRSRQNYRWLVYAGMAFLLLLLVLEFVR